MLAMFLVGLDADAEFHRVSLSALPSAINYSTYISREVSWAKVGVSVPERPGERGWAD